MTTRGGDDGVKGFYGGSQGGRSQTELLELNWISGSLREDTSKSVEPRDRTASPFPDKLNIVFDLKSLWIFVFNLFFD